MKRRVTRYNDRIGPDMSSGMIVLTIFIATVVILSVYFACNAGVDEPDVTGAASNAASGSDEATDAPEDAPYFSGSETDTVDMPDSGVARGKLILVNKWHPYTFGDENDIVILYHNEEKSDAYKLALSNIACRHDILQYLNAFLEAYRDATGDEDAILNSGYRGYDEQKELLEERIATDGEEEAYKYVSLPGQSEHHTGLTMDIASTGANSDPVWMPQHCSEFGFVQRYRADKQEITGIWSEYWHYRYVGKPHAEIMMKENLCLEEYIDKLHGYSYEHPLEFTSSDGGEYVIYYTECENDGETAIKVPRGAAFDAVGEGVGDFVYTVSGDNVSGFIVTLCLKAPSAPSGSGDAGTTAATDASGVTDDAAEDNGGE